MQWSPKGNEFCVVYGFMPANASLFNLKCEPIHHFGPGGKNAVYYNPFGNLLLIAGFGNLPGQVEIYDAKMRRIVSQVNARESTMLEWSPDGEYFITATTAPRLRQGNG